MRMFIALILTAILSACTSLGPSPEQLKAMDGLSSSMCFESPGWNGSAVKVHVASFGGKSTGTAGGGGEATCGSSAVKFNNEGRAEKPTTKPSSAP